MKIAVIGAGISGLVCAYQLCGVHAVTLFEAEQRVGGHTRTVRVDHEGREWSIDTGFIVFNERNYPNFSRLLERLGVRSAPTSMSFSVRSDHDGVEYGGGSLSSLFASRSDLLRPRHYRMVRDILRFGRQSPADLERYGDAPMREYLGARGFSAGFVEHYLVPMGAAIWSSGTGAVREMPMRFFVEFFRNHGMLLPGDRPQWRVVEGGSHTYVRKLMSTLRATVRVGTPVRRVMRDAAGVEVRTDAGAERFDHVVFAVHSDQAKGMLGDPTPAEESVLGVMGYTPNRAALHSDIGALPRRRRAWSAWNYRLRAEDPGHADVTYNMAILQGLRMERPLCVTLNAEHTLEASRVHDRHGFEHPAYTRASIAAQSRHAEISGAGSRAHGGSGRTHFCGAYWGNGFHEDGVVSALRVCREFGAGVIA